MNEFLSQFLIECRDFVAEATAGLLALERSPADTEVLDGVFRAFHTLKGGAGIVEFAAMERAVHAAEGVLSDARAGHQVLTAPLIGDCLHSLDQVAQWLDVIEQTGELPAPDAAAKAADAIVLRFAAASPSSGNPKAVAAGSARDWVRRLLELGPPLDTRAMTAVRFVPEADCFYRGEDPVARLTGLPQLLRTHLETGTPLPPLASFDPFQCMLTLTALSAAPEAELAAHMAGCHGECEIVALGVAPMPVAPGTLSDRAREVVVAQIAVLADVQDINFVGQVTAAGRTAANVLRFARQPQQAEVIARATQQSVAEHSIQPLLLALGAVQGAPITAPTEAPVAPRPTATISRTLRVDAERIDALVRLTSELTVAKNSVGHLFKLAEHQGNSLAPALRDRHSALAHLVSELQNAVLGMRVLPLRTVLQRFPRIVREMSASLGKPLNFDIEGDDTEADKVIVEMLFEPLLHILRNAVDHGIESAQRRAELGKPAIASIRIRAAREADRVVLEVRDDGGGVDVGKVREAAKRRGIVTEEQLLTLTDAAVTELIFAPGFSTSAAVTELSGRGVGMDAVRTAVERVGGRVSIDSELHRGTTVRILLPFSVMLSRVMTVEAGGQIFGVPLEAIVETVRVPTASVSAVGAAHAVVLRERTIPVVRLASALGLRHDGPHAEQATIVVTTSAGQWVGIQVDRLGEQLEVILQPLEGLLVGTPGISGTTLLGDGRVLLVLDTGAMLQ